MTTETQIVPRITDLKSTLMFFAGHTLSNSIAQAQAWASERGLTLNKYYIQIAHGGRSIIASFGGSFFNPTGEIDNE